MTLQLVTKPVTEACHACDEPATAKIQGQTDFLLSNLALCDKHRLQLRRMLEATEER